MDAIFKSKQKTNLFYLGILVLEYRFKKSFFCFFSCFLDKTIHNSTRIEKKQDEVKT